MSLLSPPHAPANRPASVHTTASSLDDEVQSGRAWARSVDHPWDPLILTLDGGGIRGYSSLLILQALMHEIAQWENKLEVEEGPIPGSKRHTFDPNTLLPCHYFDYMYGTSTGGLIATMLGRLRMTVPQCLEIYREVGDNLFGKRRSVMPLATKYDHRPLESAVRRIVRKHCKIHPPGQCPGDDWYPWNATENGQSELEEIENICQSICLTATHNGRIDEAHLLRTYPHHYQDGVPNWITMYNAGADKLRIWEVTRATSAAPFFFKILEADIQGETKSFKDGGIRENNPAGAAWSEFVSMYGEDRNPGLLLSVGTGRPNEDHDGFASAWPGPFGKLKITRKAAEKFAVFKNVLIKYTEGEEKHRSMVLLAKGEHRWYKRLNVSTGLESMKLDNWEHGLWTHPSTGQEQAVKGGRSLRRMEEATQRYLGRGYDRRYDTYAPPGIMISQTAEKLVRHRRARERARAQNPRHWETYMGQWLTGVRKNDEDGVVEHDLRSQNGRRRSATGDSSQDGCC